MEKQLLKGEMDYDDQYDILLFKAANRLYRKSIELDDVVLHFDPENRIMGVQIFDASEFLNLPKEALLKIPQWELRAAVNEGKIEIRLTLKVKVGNETVKTNPIIIQSLSDSIPDSELVCEMG
ncbi:MAG TPA: DUF2283 domain-containing protein [Candidatus Nanoarchaeia archaeon]|nr:DUF2283 domain-containing protein [Candidatus Nanoarchaeia archaeon]